MLETSALKLLILSTQLIILNYTVNNLTNLKVLMEWPRSQQLKNQAVMALKTENILKIHKQICQIGKNARSVNCGPLHRIHSCTHVPNISVLCYNYCKTKNQLEIIILKLRCFTRKAVTVK